MLHTKFHACEPSGFKEEDFYALNFEKEEEDFYALNFEDVEAAYWFRLVRLSVRLSVTPFVGCKTRKQLELGTCNFICSISTNKRA